MQKEFTVSVSADRDGQADFETLGEAILSLPKEEEIPAVIKVAPGVYHEKLELRRANVKIEGTGNTPEETVITYEDCGFYRFPDGSKMGTFRSYTFLVFTHDVRLKNLTIQNPSAPSCDKGQAIALYAEGNDIFAENCHILGHQDTLFIGPLPEKEYEPNGFLGPTEHAPRINGYQPCGFVFHNCTFMGPCPKGSVYLGRPWRDFGRCVLINCYLGTHIHPEGFHDWGKIHAHDTVYFGEYGSAGEGAEGKRADFVTVLKPEEVFKYQEENVRNSVKTDKIC